MPRCKKDADRLTIKLDRKISEDLKRYSLKTGLTKTKIIEIALLNFLKSIDKESKQISP